MNTADVQYRQLLMSALLNNKPIQTRNGAVYRAVFYNAPIFNSAPIIQARKTAVKLALKEFEWMLSRNPSLPSELEVFWHDQIHSCGNYVGGYNDQFLRSRGITGEPYNQIRGLIAGLREDRYSRRHLITSWNPADMSMIQRLNNNSKTPACCHTTIGQFIVEGDDLYYKVYQRSADLLLGLPHNWIQSWAFFLWVADQTGLRANSMQWNFGDAHVYAHPSHVNAAREIIAAKLPALPDVMFEHEGPAPLRLDDLIFKADEFVFDSDAIRDPVVKIKPKLIL
jgi:thymidylate synthase